MAKNQESINRSLFELLRSRGYAPTLLDTSGKEIPVPEEAEVFQFKFTKDGEEYGTVTASIDGLHKLIIYFGDDVANSEKEDNGGDDSWYKLLNHLKRFAQQHQLSFEVKNRDHLKYDMAKREHMKKQEKISEGYHSMGKSRSYNDNVPTVKIVIEHTRQIEEGEQRYRNVNRIFLENTHGERILAPTTKPGVAQIYARHLAEGGMPHDDRWNHIIGLCEEYNKMGAFVRAIRNNQFNESAQQLVNEGINHYQSLRESLSKMRGTRGYNSYFESYTPPLMEDESEENNLNELFVQETLDPRIESVMPILSKLHKKVAEMKEVNELSEWADSLTEIALEEGDGGQQAVNPAGIPEEDLDEGLMDKIKGVATKGMNWATNKAQPAQAQPAPAAPAAVVPNAATQARIAAAPQGYDPNTGKPQVAARAVPGAVQKGGIMDMSKKVTPVARPAAAPAAAPAQSDYDYSPQEVQQMNQRIAAMDPATLAQVAARTNLDPTVTAAVKAEVTRRKTPPAAQPNAGAPVEEGMVDTIKSGVKKGMDTVKKVGGEVLDKLGGGSEEQLIRDLQKAAGVKVTGKKPEPKDKPVGEGLDDAQKADQKIKTPAVDRKEKGGDWKVTKQDLDKADEKNMTSSAGMAALKKRMNTIEGWKGELAGGTLGGVGGTVAGSALGALAGGPIGAAVGGVIGGAAGGTGGQMVGREITKEEQLNEFGPLLAAGARAIMPLLSRVGPALGRMASTAGKTGAEVAGKAATGIGRGTADVAKSAAGSAAQNAGKIGVGVGAYEAITDVAKGLVGGVGEVYHDAGKAAGAIAQSVGNAIDGKTIGELASAAVKYSIPIGILLAVLYGGKKLIDQVMSEGADDSEMGAIGKMVGKAIPNPSDFVAGFKKTFEGQEDLDVIKRLISK